MVMLCNRILAYCDRVIDLKLYNDFLIDCMNVKIDNIHDFDKCYDNVYERYENLLRRLSIIEDITNDNAKK